MQSDSHSERQPRAQLWSARANSRRSAVEEPFLYHGDGCRRRQDNSFGFAVRGIGRGVLEAHSDGHAGGLGSRDRDAAGGNWHGPHDRRSVQICAARLSGLGRGWAGTEIDLGRINLPTSLNNDWVVIEGVGGVLVPINQKQFMLDMMVKFKLPVILAARSSIGT